MRFQTLNTPKVAALVTGIVALLGVARVGCLFAESYAVVREERNQDSELVELCARGDARNSPKMRAACLQARSDRASPVIAKALVHAFTTAVKDFGETFGSPFKLSVLALFLASSIVSPLIGWLRAFSSLAKLGSIQEENMDYSNSHFMVIPPDIHKQGWRKRVARHLPMLRQKAHVKSPHNSDSEEDYESGREDPLHRKYE